MSDANALPQVRDELDAMPTAEILQQLYDGRLMGERVSPETRRRCVAYMVAQGFTNAEMAELLRVSERTVQRDRMALRREMALAPDRRLGDELLGEFQQIVLSSVARLLRLVREGGRIEYARVRAEEAMVRIYRQLIDTAYRLRYLEDGGRRLSDQHLHETNPVLANMMSQLLGRPPVPRDASAAGPDRGAAQTNGRHSGVEPRMDAK